MRKTSQKIFIIVLFCILQISNLQSQISNPQSSVNNLKSKNPWWVNLGAGPALIGSDFGLTAGMTFSYQIKNTVISARMIGMTNINPTAQKIDPSSTKYKMTDYGILYGAVWTDEEYLFSAGAGIGLVRAAYDNSSIITTNTSISLPLEIQIFWRMYDFFGLGFYGHTSFSFEKPLYGLMISAQLGIW